jgi:hypothetical protein
LLYLNSVLLHILTHFVLKAVKWYDEVFDVGSHSKKTRVPIVLLNLLLWYCYYYYIFIKLQVEAVLLCMCWDCSFMPLCCYACFCFSFVLCFVLCVCVLPLTFCGLYNWHLCCSVTTYTNSYWIELLGLNPVSILD